MPGDLIPLNRNLLPDWVGLVLQRRWDASEEERVGREGHRRRRLREVGKPKLDLGTPKRYRLQHSSTKIKEKMITRGKIAFLSSKGRVLFLPMHILGDKAAEVVVTRWMLLI
jgi:hypothetical protein